MVKEMYDRIVWQYWDNSQEFPDGIPYINLCHKSLDIHSTIGKGYKVIRLNKNTINDYIDINPFIFNIGNNSNQLAQKTDYFRAKLLYKYGGIWLDSDSIIINSLDSIFDKLEKFEFYGYKIIQPCVWGFACRKNATIMKKWCENNERILNETQGNNIFFGEFGHQSLRLFMDDPNSFFDDANSTVHALDHRYAWKYIDKNNIDNVKNYLFENQPFIMLNNAVIYDDIKKMSEEELKESKMMLCDFLRIGGVL
jgi:Capsular polysaccharide synthesis protein